MRVSCIEYHMKVTVRRQLTSSVSEGTDPEGARYEAIWSANYISLNKAHNCLYRNSSSCFQPPWLVFQLFVPQRRSRKITGPGTTVHWHTAILLPKSYFPTYFTPSTNLKFSINSEPIATRMNTFAWSLWSATTPLFNARSKRTKLYLKQLQKLEGKRGNWTRKGRHWITLSLSLLLAKATVTTISLFMSSSVPLSNCFLLITFLLEVFPFTVPKIWQTLVIYDLPIYPGRSRSYKLNSFLLLHSESSQSPLALDLQASIFEARDFSGPTSLDR